jgi:hypothetical protein
VARPRAADDFAMIRAGMEELRRERDCQRRRTKALFSVLEPSCRSRLRKAHEAGVGLAYVIGAPWSKPTPARECRSVAVGLAGASAKRHEQNALPTPSRPRSRLKAPSVSSRRSS